MKNGLVLPGNILKVDRFINHIIDPILFEDLVSEFYEKFKCKKINKILTIEVSGIAMAYACGIRFNYPAVFAKKTSSETLGDNCYRTGVFNFTKNRSYEVMVSREYLDEKDHILLIDDLLIDGKALEGLIGICPQANATVEGIGILIEKVFQEGGENLRRQEYTIESLVRIKGFADDSVIFEN